MLTGVETTAHLKTALANFIRMAFDFAFLLVIWSLIWENFSEKAQKRRERRR